MKKGDSIVYKGQSGTIINVDGPIAEIKLGIADFRKVNVADLSEFIYEKLELAPDTIYRIDSKMFRIQAINSNLFIMPK